MFCNREVQFRCSESLGLGFYGRMGLKCQEILQTWFQIKSFWGCSSCCWTGSLQFCGHEGVRSVQLIYCLHQTWCFISSGEFLFPLKASFNVKFNSPASDVNVSKYFREKRAFMFKGAGSALNIDEMKRVRTGSTCCWLVVWCKNWCSRLIRLVKSGRFYVLASCWPLTFVGWSLCRGLSEKLKLFKCRNWRSLQTFFLFVLDRVTFERVQSLWFLNEPAPSGISPVPPEVKLTRAEQLPVVCVDDGLTSAGCPLVVCTTSVQNQSSVSTQTFFCEDVSNGDGDDEMPARCRHPLQL